MPHFRRVLLHSLPPAGLSGLALRLNDVSMELFVHAGLAADSGTGIPGTPLPEEAFSSDLLLRKTTVSPEEPPDLLIILDSNPGTGELIRLASVTETVILVTESTQVDELSRLLESGASMEDIRKKLADMTPTIQQKASSGRPGRITESMALVHLAQDMTGPVDLLDGPEAEPIEKWNGGNRPLFRTPLFWLLLAALASAGTLIVLRII